MTAPAPTPARIACPYCLGPFVPCRSDAVYCSGSCRTAACRAVEAAEVDPPSLGTRRENYSAERAKATGYGSITPREGYLADLRVRAIASREVEARSVWEALDALPGGHDRIGLDAATWAALGVRLEQQRSEVRAWLAQQSDGSTNPWSIP